MAKYRVVTEEMLQEAMLGGIPCRAFAYVEVIRVEVPADERGRTKLVEGVRTWRGTAVVEAPALPQRWHLDRALRYDGVLLDGDQERPISADVFVYQTRRTKPPHSPDRIAEAAEPQQIYVSFVGAGNHPLHPAG
jgi:hypothetical protein